MKNIQNVKKIGGGGLGKIVCWNYKWPSAPNIRAKFGVVNMKLSDA